MKSSEYWQKRFSLLEDSRHNAGAEIYKTIERQYQRAKKEIESEISRWYRRIADNNGVSMAEARKLLKADELKEFHWDVDEYIKYGEEHEISGEWAKELENASAKFHISRLEALEINTRQSVEALYGKQQTLVSDFLGETYKSDYYHTAFELQKGFEIGFDIGTVNDDYLQKVFYKPWAPDGSNFSDRIWANKDKLLNEIHTELTQSILTGADPQKAIDAISHDLDVSKANAGRLVMTESAYFGTLAQQDCFNDLGVEEYEIVATLDDRTSAICQSMDGQHFPMKDFEAGVSAPPFHVNCRSCTCPYFDDEFSLGERAARDENGEVYYVPVDMTYPEWKEAFVDGGSKEGLIKHEESDKIDKGINLFKNDSLKEWIVGKPWGGAIAELESAGVFYNPVKELDQALSVKQIIEKVGDTDITEMSCSSLAFAYAGNRIGLNVLDFRGGDSMRLFGDDNMIVEIANLADSKIIEASNDFEAASELLATMVEGREYYFSTGEHAAIVRKIKDTYEYLELQRGKTNGFKSLTEETLKERFNCQKSNRFLWKDFKSPNVLIDIKSLKGNKVFEQLLGYLNTK